MTTPSPIVTGFYDQRIFSIQDVVACAATLRCAFVDPVTLQAGRPPSPSAAGRRVLRFPLDALGGAGWG